jgi:GTPase SAR1 family protein
MAAALRINKTPVVFNTLENAQNVETIAKVFANNKPNVELKPNPYCVIVVGAPGVGKTTKTQEIIKRELGLNYNDFYNISLDSLVEKVKPYRNTTRRLHNTLKAKKADLNNTNFAILSEVYLPTIMSNKRNFTLEATELAKKAKINALGNTKALEALKKGKSTTKNGPTGLKHLNDLRRDGLIYGAMNGLNIIYDTTLTKTKDKIKMDIMPILEMNKDVKYKIIVILVTANIENIQNRIKGRHTKMLAESDPYIRAINPRLTKMFIEDNKKGFDMSKAYFNSNSYYTNTSSTFYTKDDFKFIEVDNPPLRNNTRKNNNNNNNFKYF